MANVRSKRWLVTINNPVGTPADTFKIEGIVIYAIWQLERGERGTPHIQGYVELNVKSRTGTVSALAPRGHWIAARGTAAENKTYCSKTEGRLEGPFEIGAAMAQGARIDLEETRVLIENGIIMKELAQKNFPQFVRNYKAFQFYAQLIAVKRTWKTKVYCITGPTGIGKSHYVFEHAPDAFRQTNKHWFSQYQGEADVVLDEFYGSRCSYSFLLMLLDEYPMTVETKGGEVNFAPKRIWITSNKPAWEWYQDEKLWPALERRIENIKHYYDQEVTRIDVQELDKIFGL